MRKRIISSLLVFLLVFTSAGIAPVSVQAAETGSIDAAVAVDTDTVIIDDYMGVGIQWDPSDIFEYTDQEWTLFMQRIQFLKPKWVRLMIHDADSYCIEVKEDGTRVYKWDSPIMKRTYKILDYCQQNGVSVMFGEWNDPASRGAITYSGIEEDDIRWAEMIADSLKYLIGEKGYTCIKYYNMLNEPNGSWSSCFDWNRFKAAMKNLKTVFDTTAVNESGTKISDMVKIIGPDNSGDNYWISNAVDQIPDLLGAYDTHWYAEASEVQTGKIESEMKKYRNYINTYDPNGSNKPFIMGEAGLSTGKTPNDCQPNTLNYWYGVSMADFITQTMRAGMDAITAWMVEDSMHLQKTDLVRNVVGDYEKNPGDKAIDYALKQWGMWNSKGPEMEAQGVIDPGEGAKQLALRPWYFTWSLFSRTFPEGSRIVNTGDTGLSGVRTTAAIVLNEDNANQALRKYDVSIAVVNNSGTARKVRVSIPNVENVVTLRQYNFTEANCPKEIADVKNASISVDRTNINLRTGYEVDVPANGFVILSTLNDSALGATKGTATTLSKNAKPAAGGISISTPNNADTVPTKNTLQLSASVQPEGAAGTVLWSVYNENNSVTDKAEISNTGLLTTFKSGTVKVVASLLEDVNIKSEKTIAIVPILTDELVDYSKISQHEGSQAFDTGNPDYFGGDTSRIKTGDGSQTSVTYTVYGMSDFDVNVGFENKSSWNLSNEDYISVSYSVYTSTDMTTWTPVAIKAENIAATKDGWYKANISPVDPATIGKETRYLKIQMKVPSPAVTTDPWATQITKVILDFTKAGDEVPVTGVRLSKSSISLKVGETQKLTATVEPESATTKTYKWSSDNVGIATVSSDGTVNAIAAGNTIVKVTTDDGKRVATCNVEVIPLSPYVNLALGKTAVASSIINREHPEWDSEHPAAWAVDGKMDTRWSSSWENNEWFYVDLGTQHNVRRIKINWEASYGKDYEIQVSNDTGETKNWTTVYTVTNSDGGLDEITIKPTMARYVKMKGNARASSYGYSIYEFEVYEEVNLAAGKTASASSIINREHPEWDSEHPAAWAVDGKMDTRWSSSWEDNEWFSVDLGAVFNKVQRVKINWEASYGKNYEIQVSSDGQNWTTVSAIADSDGGVDEISFNATPARYVKMKGIKRNNQYGYSIYEFEVYETPAAESLADKFLKFSYSDRTKYQHDMPYRLFVPKGYDPTKSYPLVLVLHGAGERGTDNEKQIKSNNSALVWADPKSQESNPCFVLAPQCPDGESWVDTDATKGSYSQDKVPASDEIKMAIDIIKKLEVDYKINANKIYATGLSMGGFGTWDISLRYPNVFAAIAPVCGAGDPARTKLIAAMPIWAFHGDADDVVPVSGSREMIDAIKALGGTPKYTEYAGVKHSSWVQAYDTPGLITWMFAQDKSTSTPVTASDVAQCIKAIPTPAKDTAKLTLPEVPDGFAIGIKSSTQTGIVALDGTIVSPDYKTKVRFVLEVTNISSSDKASTSEIEVEIPGMFIKMPFTVSSNGKLERTAGIKATATINTVAGVGDHTGKETVVFKLLKGDKVVDVITVERNITTATILSSYFNVPDHGNSAYKVEVVVVDSEGELLVNQENAAILN